MKRIFFLTMTLVMASFFIACDPAANTGNKPANAPANNANAATSTTNHEADVKKLVTDLSAALQKNDAAALDKFYADDYRIVNPDGSMNTKAQRLEMIKAGDLKYETLAAEDIKVRSYGDTAVANYTATVKAMNKGKDISAKYSVTVVAVKGKDGWKVVNGQSTKTETPAKTDDKAKADDKKADPAAAVKPATPIK